jgi:hypothetical protein
MLYSPLLALSVHIIFSSLKTEAVHSSETLVNFCQTSLRLVSENGPLLYYSKPSLIRNNGWEFIRVSEEKSSPKKHEK